MLEKNQAERATAKELKDLIKSCNIIDDTIKKDKIDTLWIEEPNKKINLLKTKKYILLIQQIFANLIPIIHI
jgi:hypothetical protein